MSTFVALEQRRELAVDGRLRQVELDELDLAAGPATGGRTSSASTRRVPRVLLEPAQQLAAEERARPGHRDDAAGGCARRCGAPWRPYSALRRDQRGVLRAGCVDSVIAVLPATVVDQIAAGEVIERPASVVKELVDNAIDAGARTIAVETAAGGRALIRVVDDGCGMSPDDAVLAFERHATCKLRAVDDLWGPADDGLPRRGAAVDRERVADDAHHPARGRSRGDPRRRSRAGGSSRSTEVGAPVGTTRRGPRPALQRAGAAQVPQGRGAPRRRTSPSSSRRVAMAHPAAARAAAPQRPHRARRRRRIAMGSRGRRRCSAHADRGAASCRRRGEEGGVRVTAFLGAPELAQTTARGVQLFVGRAAGARSRPAPRASRWATASWCRAAAIRSRSCCSTCPAGAVDINVHPQKHEVRFADASAVCAAVRHVVQAGVARAPWRDETAARAAVMMTAIASVAPPTLPSMAPATALAQRYAAQLRERARRVAGLGEASWLTRRRARVGRGRRDRARSAAGTASRRSRAGASRAHDRAADPSRSRPIRVGRAEALATARRRSRAGLLRSAALPRPARSDVPRVRGRRRARADRSARRARARRARAAAARAAIATSRPSGCCSRRRSRSRRSSSRSPTRHRPACSRGSATRSRRSARPRSRSRRCRPASATAIPRAAARAARRAGPTTARRARPSSLERVLAEIACHSVVRAGDRLSPSEAEALLRVAGRRRLRVRTARTAARCCCACRSPRSRAASAAERYTRARAAGLSSSSDRPAPGKTRLSLELAERRRRRGHLARLAAGLRRHGHRHRQGDGRRARARAAPPARRRPSPTRT